MPYAQKSSAPVPPSGFETPGVEDGTAQATRQQPQDVPQMQTQTGPQPQPRPQTQGAAAAPESTFGAGGTRRPATEQQPAGTGEQESAPAPGSSTQAPPPAAPPASGPQADMPDEFSRRDWSIVGLAALEGLLWVLVFDPWASFAADSYGGQIVPGLGITLFALIAMGIAYGLLRGRCRIDVSTVLLNVATILVALSFALFANDGLRFLNLFVLLAVATFSLFVTSGIWQGGWGSARAFFESIGFFFSSLFVNLTLPIRQLGKPRNGSNAAAQQAPAGHRRGVWLGIGLALLLFVVVLPLLASADAAFGAIFSGLFEAVNRWLASLNLYRVFVYVVHFLVATPFMFALLYNTVHARPRVDAARVCGGGLAGRIPPLTICIVLAAADALYLLFVAVQFFYLFGGNEAPAMHGGYAEYARSGFFQLVTVAAINVCIGLVVAKAAAANPDLRRVVQVLAVLLVAFTAVILVSALWRMMLYIGVYGLSVLRVGTLFIMAYCAVLLVAVALKLFVHSVGFFKVCFVSGLALWVGFNYINPSALVANYNADAYLAGAVEEFDAWYVAELGPDGLPALARVAESGSGPVAREAGQVLRLRKGEPGKLSWQYWSLPYAWRR